MVMLVRYYLPVGETYAVLKLRVIQDLTEITKGTSTTNYRIQRAVPYYKNGRIAGLAVKYRTYRPRYQSRPVK